MAELSTEAKEALPRLVPAHIVGPLYSWILRGKIENLFMQAVICNDLEAACLYADDESLKALRNTILWMRSYAPAECFGSAQAITHWHSKFAGK